MSERNFLASRFESQRARLRSIAYRMLGSRSEAEDAVQEAWLRLARQQESEVENLPAWLTTVVARVCLDMLRARKSRHEQPLESLPSEREDPDTVAQERELADSMGLAVLIVLETLSPAERIAFVLHDMFDVSFDSIAPIVERTPAAARQLASRARRRVRGASLSTQSDRSRQQKIVEAFLAASREGNLRALLALLDPQVTFRPDAVAARLGSIQELKGAETVAAAFKGRAQAARPALIDGTSGIAVERENRIFLVLRLSFDGDRITAIKAIADPESIAELDVSIPGEIQQGHGPAPA